MKKEKKQSLLVRFLYFILKKIKKQPIIVNLNEHISERAIFVSNHSAANGPLTLSLYFPKPFRPWGIYYMCQGYKSRWKYLYYVFYQQKLKWGKVKSFIVATLFSIISGVVYRAMEVIPSYTDGRLKTSIKLSIAHLEQNQSVLIFPENSDDGYHKVLTHYNPGFVFLAEQFFKKHNIDVPIYTVYFSKADNALIIDEPKYIQPLIEKGMDKKAIAEIFKKRTNELYNILQSKLKSNKSVTESI